MDNHQYRVNNRIRISPVRVIKDDENLGIMDLRSALKIAQEEGLDLVEVVPDSRPPVCKIIDFGKLKYENAKREKERKKHTKICETKQIRCRPSTDIHDLKIKSNQAISFLTEGHKVLLNIKLKGRESSEFAEKIASSFTDLVKEHGIMESRSWNGKQLNILFHSHKGQNQNEPSQS